ncbi:hypothetical protein ACHAWF_004724 [Thalassiosira exigua]
MGGGGGMGMGMGGMMGRGGGSRGRRGRRTGGYDDAAARPLGPVEELYDDVYDDLSGPQDDLPPLAKLFAGPKGGGRAGGLGGGFDRPASKLNIGIPKREYLKVTPLNAKYDAYKYSVVKATRGKAAAAAELRAKGFASALERSLGVSGHGNLGEISAAEGTALLTLERDFLAAGAELTKEAGSLAREIANAAVLEEMEAMGVEAGVIDAVVEKNETVIDAMIVDGDGEAERKDEKKEAKKEEKKKPRKIEKHADIVRATKEVEAINTELRLLELDFLQSVVEILGPNRADAIRTAVAGNVLDGESGTLLRALTERPLATILSSLDGGEGTRRKNLFVTRFPGDVTASQLNELREEVTGILRASQPRDEALLILQSGGGTVTGYGLAAAQLQRFKANGMKLTVIGVISEIPNAYDRLKKEGIEFQTVTAGKYKRTVTPTKKVTKEDLAKSTEDIQEIFDLFKSFVASQRPQLDIEDVATGDTWFGEDALEKGLCDELAAADDVLLEFADGGYDLYEVAYDPGSERAGRLLAGLPGGGGGLEGWRGALRSVVRGVVKDVKDEVMVELSSSVEKMNSVEQRYMAKDPSDAANRVQAKE